MRKMLAPELRAKNACDASAIKETVVSGSLQKDDLLLWPVVTNGERPATGSDRRFNRAQCVQDNRMNTMQVPEPNTEYEVPPAGTYAATYVEFIDFGTQQTTYGPKRQRLGWEIAGQLMKTGLQAALARALVAHSPAPSARSGNGNDGWNGATAVKLLSEGETR